MSKQEILDEINKTKEHLANIEKMLAECKGDRYKPNDDEIYYYVNAYGGVSEERFLNNYEFDRKRYEFYNCFQTCEQAEAEAEKILIRRQLEDIARRLNNGEKIDWTKQGNKYHLYYDHYGKEVELETGNGFQYQGTVYCLAPNFKDVAIQEIGEERLKKYFKVLGE